MNEQEISELFEINSPNKFSSLIDTLYSVGARLSDEEPGIINSDVPLKCRLLLKHDGKLWLADLKDVWPIEGKLINGDLMVRLDLDKLDTRPVRPKKKE